MVRGFHTSNRVPIQSVRVPVTHLLENVSPDCCFLCNCRHNPFGEERPVRVPTLRGVYPCETSLPLERTCSCERASWARYVGALLLVVVAAIQSAGMVPSCVRCLSVWVRLRRISAMDIRGPFVSRTSTEIR